MNGIYIYMYIERSLTFLNITNIPLHRWILYNNVLIQILKVLLWLTLECSMYWKSTSFTERTWSPSCSPALWASESGTTCQHITHRNLEMFEKQTISIDSSMGASKSHTKHQWYTHTLDIKIPNCDALPPRMLKPSCAPGGFFNTMVRGRNWVSSLL